MIQKKNVRTDVSKNLKLSKFPLATAIRKVIIREALLGHTCSICGIYPQWQNEILDFQIDHINSNNKDHRIENLRLVCPNCHAQLPSSKQKQKIQTLEEYYTYNWSEERVKARQEKTFARKQELDNVAIYFLKMTKIIGTGCSVCGIEYFYNNKFLMLQMDHINGNKWDNRKDNLQLLCPNCHSQTITFHESNNRYQHQLLFDRQDEQA